MIITRSQSGHQSFEDFIKSLSKKERDKLLRQKKELKIYYSRQAQEGIIEDIDQHEKHLELLRFCAKAFAKTVLSEKSGYQFYFTEPLIEFCYQHSRLKNFDIFLFNETIASAIFIECKTSISPSDAKNDLKTAIKLVEDKLDYLSQVVGVKLEREKIEYVLCIYEKDRSKFEASFKDRSYQQDDNCRTNLFKLWIYSPHSDIIRLYLDHTHIQPELSNMLLKGFNAKNSKGRFELPYEGFEKRFYR